SVPSPKWLANAFSDTGSAEAKMSASIRRMASKSSAFNSGDSRSAVPVRWGRSNIDRFEIAVLPDRDDTALGELEGGAESGGDGRAADQAALLATGNPLGVDRRQELGQQGPLWQPADHL